jgi:chromosome condensin MukBEF MukE localization factor
MESDRSPLSSDLLPEKLAEVFRSLRSSRHICRDDGVLYRDLEFHEENYQVIFAGLGYELIHHGQGFYYLKGGSTLTSQRLQAVALFMLILFQDLEDKKFQETTRGWERTLLDRVFRLDDLPHFATAQRRNMMYTVGVTAETLQYKVIRPLSMLGMLQVLPEGQFQFRPPVYRFIDLCLLFSGDDWAQGLAGGNSQASKEPQPSPEGDHDDGNLPQRGDEP